MARSTFDPAGLDSKGYGNGKEVRAPEWRNSPGGSLASSANELARYLQLIFAEGHLPDGQELIRRDTLRSMFTAQFEGAPLDFGNRTGLGWMLTGIEVEGAGPIAWHDGAVPGYHAHVAVAPDTKLGVVVLANDGAAGAFAGRVGSKAIALALETRLGIPEREKPKSGKLRPVEVPAEALDAYVGDYLGMGQVTHLGRSGDRLVADAFGRHFELAPIGPDLFVPEASALLGLVHKQLSDFAIAFSTVEGRRFGVLRGLGRPLPFERIVRRPLPPSWTRRLGQCRADADDGVLKFRQVRLEFADSLLVADVRIANEKFGGELHARVLLDPVDDRTAVVMGEGGVVRVIGDPAHEKLFYSGYTFTCYHGP